MTNSIQIDFDALKKDNWSEQDTLNAKMVIELVQHLMNDHDFDYILEKFGDNPYLQHNRLIPDSVKGIVKYIGDFASQFPEFSYDVKHVYVDGDYVTLHSHATTRKKDRGNDKKGYNISDTWKLENGRVVEHWDSVQPIDLINRFYATFTGGKIRNPNGVF
jgi:predicted SnoaL-like aldol condensation-catalyzing enzyme